MSAPAYADPPAVVRERDGQRHLFALPGGVEAPVRVGVPRTLEAELGLAWTALSAGAPAACLICDGRMEPLPSAPGGRCRDCGATLE